MPRDDRDSVVCAVLFVCQMDVTVACDVMTIVTICCISNSLLYGYGYCDFEFATYAWFACNFN